MRDRLEYAAVWLLLKIFGAFRARSLAFRSKHRALLYTLLPKLRKTAEFNLRLAFPDWSDKKRAAVTRAMLRNLGWMAAEFARLKRYNAKNIERYVILDGHENFLEGSAAAKASSISPATSALGSSLLRACTSRIPAALHGTPAR